MLNKYYKSTNLITLNNLFHSDCFQTINFMKRKIHFNLFLHEQLEHFFSACQKIEFNFVFNFVVLTDYNDIYKCD